MASHNGSPGGGWIGELDGLRALACLAVVVVHFNPGWTVPPGLSVYSLSRGLAYVSGANLGVIFFYTLSAFILTYLAVREYARSGTFDVRRFYARRCLRIWPLYFTVVAVAFWMIAPIEDQTGNEQWMWTREHLWLFLTFLSNWSLAFNHIGEHIDHSSPPLAILWSIAVEEQFYFVYPILILLAISSRARARGILIALACAALAWRIVFLYLPVNKPSMGSAGGMYYATLTYLDVFAAGAGAGWLAGRESAFPRVTDCLRRRWVGPLLAVALGVMGAAWGQQFWYPYSHAAVAMYGATGVLFAVVLLWTTANQDAAICRVLRSAPLRTVGVLSFGIYMWHPVAGELVNANLIPLMAAPDMSVELRTLISFSYYISVAIGMAAITYGLIERPFLRLKTRLAASQSSRHRFGTPPSSASWGWITLTVAVSAVSLEALLLAGFGSASTGLRTLLQIGPRPPAEKVLGSSMRKPTAPTAAQLAEILHVRVDIAEGEVNQYLIRATPGSVDLSRLGTIHTDVGYAVGITLPSGARIGFRYEPISTGRPPDARADESDSSSTRAR